MPPAILAAVAVGTTVAGGIAGAIERSSASTEAKRMMQQRLEEYNKAGMPPESALPLVLQEFKQQGTISPALEKEINVGASKVAQIKEDPQLRNASVQGLQLLQQRSDKGFGAEEEAAFNQARAQTGKETQGRLQSIIQQAQARGMGGSGAELAAQLSASQAGDSNLSAEGDRIAAERAKASRDAINQMISGNEQLRGQDFNVENTKAAAEDQLNRFRVGMEAEQQSRNIAAQNQAQASNLAEKQHLADLNTQNANQEQQRQAAAKVADWENKMQLAREKGGALGQNAQYVQGQGQANATGIANIGQGVGSAISALAAKKVADQPNTANPTNAFASTFGPTKQPNLGVNTNMTDLPDDLKQKYPGLYQ